MLLMTGLLAAVLLIGGGYHYFMSDRQATIDRVQSANLTAALLVAEKVSAILRTSDLLMVDLADDLTHGETLPQIMAHTNKLLVRFPEISYLLLIDRNGDLIATTQSAQPPKLNYTDRAYFQSHRAGADFLINAPIISRSTGKSVIPVTRRLHNADGDFTGVVFVGLETSGIDELLRKSSSWNGSASALFHLDGTLLARDPPDKIGQRFPEAQIFSHLARASSGKFEIEAALIDGKPYFYSYAAVTGFPLAVGVSTVTGDALAEWHEHLVWQPGLLITALITLLAFFMRNIKLHGEMALLNDQLEQKVPLRTAELDEKQATLRSLMDNLPYLTWMKDTEGKILAANRAYVRYLRTDNASQVIGKTDLDLHPKELAEKYRADDAMMMASRQQIHVEEQAFDGEKLYWIETFKTPVIDSHDQVVGTVGTAIDITERRLTQEELRQHRDQLEQLVQARTAQLEDANRQLSQTKDAAEAANRAKSAFLANMSHEIRTPLSAIVSITHALLRKVADITIAGQLQKIDRSANHLLQIINDILDISKVESGKSQLNLIDFSLHNLVAELVGQISDQAQAAGLGLVVDISPSVPDLLHGDPLRLRQCLFNYLGNAIKFTHEGALGLRITLDSDTQDGLLVRFSVEDTGIGIQPKDAARIFAAFEQADPSLTRQYGGTGLGLALVKQFAGLMGGTVGMDSGPGLGSRFWFTARLQPALDPDALTRKPDLPEVSPPKNLPHARLLVVDDVSLNREIVQDMLEDIGITADCANNGKIAVEMAASSHYDLILMDMQMPVMDGLSATQSIRLLPGYGLTPIIALTANAFDTDRQACLDAGMTDFLAKPILPAPLLACLRKALEA
jgi:PAS domain S-box-containing protein